MIVVITLAVGTSNRYGMESLEDIPGSHSVTHLAGAWLLYAKYPGGGVDRFPLARMHSYVARATRKVRTMVRAWYVRVTCVIRTLGRVVNIDWGRGGRGGGGVGCGEKIFERAKTRCAFQASSLVLLTTRRHARYNACDMVRPGICTFVFTQYKVLTH